MTESEFEHDLDRFGADFSQWPAGTAEERNALLARSPAARRLLGETRRVDEMLRDAFPEIEGMGLKSRVLSQVNSAPEPSSWLDWLTARLWRPVTAALIPLVLGFALGINFPEPDGEFDDSVALLAFADLQDYEDDDFGMNDEE